MGPKKKSGGGGGGAGGDKKEQLWMAIKTQKLPSVRYGIANAGVAPASRNADGLTTFLLASTYGYDKSLAEMIRFYERRDRELRACLEQYDEDDDRSCLHVACMGGHHECVRLLLDACACLDRNNSFAKQQLSRQDSNGATPRDLAEENNKSKCIDLIDEFLREPSEDEEENDDNLEGMTSTQASRLKKLALREKETGLAASSFTGGGPGSSDGVANVGENKPERGVLPTEMPTPVWAEVVQWAQSVKLLRPICELNIDQSDSATSPPPAAAAEETEGSQEAASPPPPAAGAVGVIGEDGVDPALWFCNTLNRLQLRLPSGVLTNLRQDGLVKLSNLTTLIVSGNSLTSLPDCIGELPLKNLDCARNNIKELPASMPSKTLEMLDVSGNAIESLSSISDCIQMVTLAVDDNQLKNLDDLDFDKLLRLVKLSACNNQIDNINEGIGMLSKLESLVLNNNSFTEVPSSLAACKKLKELKIDDCPVKDNKIKKYLAQAEMKQLSKYLEKNGAGGKSGGKKGKK